MISDKEKFVIVRVRDEKKGFRGTAFFVQPGLAVTCKHVVDGLSEQQIRLEGAWPGKSAVWVHKKIEHPKLDLALINIDEPDHVKAFLPIAEVWPARGDEVTFYGYSSESQNIEDRKFNVAAYHGNMFALQQKAAAGMSGGPICNGDGRVVAVGRMINEKEFTYIIPFQHVVEFASKEAVWQKKVPLPASEPLDFLGIRTVHPGLSRALRSVHMHICSGDNSDVLRTPKRRLELDGRRYEQTVMLELMQKPQDSGHSPKTKRNPAKAFSTTELYVGATNPNRSEISDIEDDVRNVLGHLVVDSKTRSDAAAGDVVVEVERVIGFVKSDGSAEWVDDVPFESAPFGSDFTFQRDGFPGSTRRYELHIMVDGPRPPGSNYPPITLDTLFDRCQRAKIPVDSWSIFDKDACWAYRSTSGIEVEGVALSSEAAKELHRLFSAQLNSLGGFETSNFSVQIVVEECWGSWSTPFQKRHEKTFSLPELAAWEAKIPSGSEFWTVTGDFIGDYIKTIESTMSTNLMNGITYNYFLRSFADLRRWLQYKEKLENGVGNRFGRHLGAFVFEFEDNATWSQELDCWIVFLPERGKRAFRLQRDFITNRIVSGREMGNEETERVVTLLQPIIREYKIVSSRRLTTDLPFDGIIVWMDFGLFESCWGDPGERAKLGNFIEQFDTNMASDVSKSCGEVIRSNEVGYVVLIPDTSIGESSQVAIRFIALIRAVIRVYAMQADRCGFERRYRITAEFGTKMKRTIRSNGRAIDSPILSHCRAEAAQLSSGQVKALGTLRELIQRDQLERAHSFTMDGDGMICGVGWDEAS